MISSLTPRIVRQKVEEACGLESGTLDKKEWKGVVREATNDALVLVLFPLTNVNNDDETESVLL